jgi:hypothetical protein
MPDTPTLQGTLGQILEQHAAEIRTVDVAEVVRPWDRSANVVDVQSVLRGEDGERPPVIVGAPVCFPGVAWDLQVGEIGLVLFCDSNPRRWWRTGEIPSVPEGIARHDIGNALFLPGLRPSTDARTIPADGVVIEKAAAGGLVYIGTPSGSSKAVVHEDLLGDLQAFLTAVNTWGGTTWGSFALQAGGWNTGVKPAVTALINGITAGSYESSVVKVED